jgi:hypothetical protein
LGFESRWNSHGRKRLGFGWLDAGGLFVAWVIATSAWRSVTATGAIQYSQVQGLDHNHPAEVMA